MSDIKIGDPLHREDIDSAFNVIKDSKLSPTKIFMMEENRIPPWKIIDSTQDSITIEFTPIIPLRFITINLTLEEEDRWSKILDQLNNEGDL